jgi:signal transduction histidine kinase
VAQGLVIGIIALDAGILAAGIVAARASFVASGWELLVWAAVVAAVGAVSLSFDSGSQLGLDMPVLLAAGFLFGPVIGGTIAAVAYVDPREFRNEVPLLRALFNRAQTSLSVMAASAVFAAMAGNAEEWPRILFGAFLAVGLDSFLNYGFVASVLALHEDIPLREAVAGLHFGSPLQFAITWFSFGLLSLTLVETYEAAGAWALALFSVPLLLARQAIASSGRLDSAKRRIEVQSEALRSASAEAMDERRDERLALAAGIHDDLLPVLFRVHLMAQVLRQDMATGRLLALEDDIPELLQATDSAADAMRALIQRLRESPIGYSGLAATLEALADSIHREFGIRVEIESAPTVQGPPLTQLLLYQVARESIRNAVRHGHAGRIRLSLLGETNSVGLVVEDDGVGFVPALVDRRKCLGLGLMKERVELIGGTFEVESEPGTGTRIVVHVPAPRRTDAP